MPNTPGVADHAAPVPKGALVARVRKLIVSVVGLAATLLAAGQLDGKAEAIVSGLVAIATAAGVYAAPNKPATPHV